MLRSFYTIQFPRETPLDERFALKTISGKLNSVITDVIYSTTRADGQTVARSSHVFILHA